MTGKKLFVTVGSTSFDALSNAVLDHKVLSELASQGFTNLVVQHGSSGRPIVQPARQLGVEIKMCAYLPSLQHELNEADLVISHAGAGSIIEALQAGKPLIVVVNESLMDNHQAELAEKLMQEGYCRTATPDNLLAAIRGCQHESIKLLPRTDGKSLNRVMKEELGSLYTC